MNIFSYILVVFLVLTASVSNSSAQTLPLGSSDSVIEQTVILPTPLTPEAVRGLVSTLNDEQVRKLLLERLDAVAATENAKNPDSEIGLVQLFGIWGKSIANSFTTAVDKVPRIWDGLKTSTSTFAERHGSSGLLKLLGVIIGSIGAGLVAEYIVNKLTRKRRENIQSFSDANTLGATLKILGSRLFWDLIALFIFFWVTRFVGQLIAPADLVPIILLFMGTMVVVPRLAWAFSRLLNAPNSPNLRLISIPDETAKYFHRNVIGLSLLIGFMGFILQFHAMYGVTVGETRLGYWINMALFIWLIVIGIQAREGLTQILIGSRPEEVTPTEFRIAKIYPWLIIGITILMWLIVEIIAGMGRFDLLGGRQYIVLTLITFSPAMDVGVRGLVRHLVPPIQGEGMLAHQAYHSTKRSYIRIGRVLLFGLVILTIAKLWDIDFINLASSGVGLGAQFVGRFIEMLMIVAIGYFVWEVLTLLLNRKLAAEQTAEGLTEEPGAGGEGGGQGGSRLSTVLPMIRFTLQIIVATITLLMALSYIGVDTTPLLAGAGIVGLAVGFGAQALVKDVVAGIFFLVDDAFRVGEYLVIGTTV
ncbi:MAG: hypothetical protein V3V02_09380, partial [Rhizobiaceae bacterium]